MLSVCYCLTYPCFIWKLHELLALCSGAVLCTKYGDIGAHCGTFQESWIVPEHPRIHQKCTLMHLLCSQVVTFRYTFVILLFLFPFALSHVGLTLVGSGNDALALNLNMTKEVIMARRTTIFIVTTLGGLNYVYRKFDDAIKRVQRDIVEAKGNAGHAMNVEFVNADGDSVSGIGKTGIKRKLDKNGFVNIYVTDRGDEHHIHIEKDYLR